MSQHDSNRKPTRSQADSTPWVSQQRLWMLFQQTSMVIIDWSVNFEVLDWNPAAERVFGYTRDEALGRHAIDLLVPEVARPHVHQVWEQLINTREGVRSVNENVTRDGRTIICDWYNTPLIDEQGNIIGLTSMGLDITERIQAERALLESEARYRTILESIKEGYYEVDLRGHYTYFNDALCELLGYSRDELMGMDARTVYMDTPTADQVFAVTNQVFRTGRTAYANDVEITTRSGERRYVEFSASLMQDHTGQTIGFRGLARDITERKRAQEELRQAKETAESANRAKSAFLANMTHELRTPLNAIIGYSEMLQEDAVDQGYGSLIPDLKKIQSAGSHLLDLINNILDLSKIEAGRMDVYLESFDVARLVDEVATTVQPLIARSGNHLTVTCEPEIGSMVADLTKVRQTLINLLGNADKFTQRGEIRLDVTRRRIDNAEWILFRVTDTGIGMTPEQVDGLFTEFSQADNSTTRRYGGTGLGLAISRRFCQMMHGDILVESEVDRGTAFIVHLPADVPARGAADAAREKLETTEINAVATLSTVLVIDDEAAVRDMLALYLTRAGFNVRTAATGADGLRLAREIRPDAITVDVRMPEMDGWAVLSALKADPLLADTPVIMLSIADDRATGIALGATDYLTKPIDRKRLLALANRYRATEGQGGHVLVVEDYDATRDIVRRALEQDGWTVAEARNGRLALESVTAVKPDLILLDLMMPDMDGFQFITEMRKTVAWQGIPVIVVTAKNLTLAERQHLNGYVERVMQTGANNRDTLLREVRDLVVMYVRYHRQQRQEGIVDG